MTPLSLGDHLPWHKVLWAPMSRPRTKPASPWISAIHLITPHVPWHRHLLMACLCGAVCADPVPQNLAWAVVHPALPAPPHHRPAARFPRSPQPLPFPRPEGAGDAAPSARLTGQRSPRPSRSSPCSLSLPNCFPLLLKKGRRFLQGHGVRLCVPSHPSPQGGSNTDSCRAASCCFPLTLAPGFSTPAHPDTWGLVIRGEALLCVSSDAWEHCWVVSTRYARSTVATKKCFQMLPDAPGRQRYSFIMTLDGPSHTPHFYTLGPISCNNQI